MLSVQCPQCDTPLSLDPNVIRQSLGWARCGHCQHVFDAAQLALPTLAPQVAPQLSHRVSENWPSLDLPSYPQDPSAPSGEDTKTETSKTPLEAAFQSTPADQSGSSSLHESEPALGDILATKGDAVEAHIAAPESKDNSAQAGTTTPDTADPLLQDTIDNASRQHLLTSATSQRLMASKAPVVALWKWVALGLLLAFLAGQLIMGQREFIAARWPQTAEPLKRMSDAMGLDLEATKDVRQLHIAHSSVTRVDAQQFQLELEVKNDGLISVALPQLELALLDSEGHVWARRVLALVPADSKTTILDANSRQAAKAFWRMSEEDAAKVDGYKLRLVYQALN